MFTHTRNPLNTHDLKAWFVKLEQFVPGFGQQDAQGNLCASGGPEVWACVTDHDGMTGRSLQALEGQQQHVRCGFHWGIVSRKHKVETDLVFGQNRLGARGGVVGHKRGFDPGGPQFLEQFAHPGPQHALIGDPNLEQTEGFGGLGWQSVQVGNHQLIGFDAPMGFEFGKSIFDRFEDCAVHVKQNCLRKRWDHLALVYVLGLAKILGYCILYTMLEPMHQSRFSKPGLIRSEVYEHLKLEIVQGRLPGGERLAEENIAASLGVSRTPVREAVQRLAQDGFVELIPNKGARVRSLSSTEIIQTYAVREALEGLAARLAAQHRDANDLDRLAKTLMRLERLPSNDYSAQTAVDLEFHAAIANASKNAVLQDTLRGLRDTIARAKLITRKTNQATETKLEHQTILKHIQNGEADAAEESARAHVQRFQKIVLEELGGK